MNPTHCLGGTLGPRVRGADDGVAALDREQCLDRRRGIRAGGRDQRGDHADRLGDFHQSGFPLLLNDTDRAQAGHVGKHTGHPLVDLGHLIGVVAKPAFVHREPGQRLGVVLAHQPPRQWR